MNLKQIKIELKKIKQFESVLFGSYVEGTFRTGSDIDVAIITRSKNFEDNLIIFNKLLGKVPRIYDIRIFELLPLTIKASIFQNYKVLFGDPLEISEYFYFYRKLWNDCKLRIEKNMFNSYKEKIIGINRLKKSLKTV
ncbi:MAG: nucleotidyltransferase family protein [Candidatus Helarchaeota archaeon]